MRSAVPGSAPFSLSAVPGNGGKDRADDLIREYLGQLPLKDWRNWDAAQITTLLDRHPDVGRAFAALMTSYELIATTHDRLTLWLTLPDGYVTEVSAIVDLRVDSDAARPASARPSPLIGSARVVPVSGRYPGGRLWQSRDATRICLANAIQRWGVMGVWPELPVDRVVRLVGASPAVLALMIVPLPPDAPAVVTYRPRSAASAVEVVASVLDELEGMALGLFPAWLPDADGIDGPGGAGVAAVRALALRTAPSTLQFGPFLADLAERALRRAAPVAGRFSAEVRAAGLAKVIAASYGRTAAALLVVVPDGLTGEAQISLVGACEWLAQRGKLGVWLVGAPLASVDWLANVRVQLPDAVASLEREVATGGQESVLPIVLYPPVAGRPHPASAAERALEQALAPLPWAAGRTWNQTYHPHPLAIPARLDLVWWQEQCVVEVDGPEHREPLRFEADRRRDVQLQIDGYAVLRFTNVQLADDLQVVVSHIKQLLQARRLSTSKGHQYAQQG